MTFMQKAGISFGVTFFLIGVCVLLGGLPFQTVERGNVGVKLRFGKVIDKHYGPGLHWKTPFIERYHAVNVQQRNAEQHSEAASNDLQVVNT